MKRTITLVVAMVLGLVLFTPATYAVNLYGNGCNGASGAVCNDLDKNGKDAANDTTDAIQSIIKLLMYVIGAVSIIVAVIGGFQMLLSGGEMEKVKLGRRMVTYALVGLLVALLGYALVGFVLEQF